MRKISILKDAYNDIFDRIFLSIIIVIQLSVSIFFLFNGINVVYDNITKINKIKSIYDVGNINAINILSDMDNFDNVKENEPDIGKRISEFSDFLNNSPDFSYIRLNNNPMAIEKFNNSNKFICSNSNTLQVDEKEFIFPKTLRGDVGYFTNFKYDILKGRYFNDDDFNISNDIPVILGNDYDGIFDVGDSITSLKDEKNEEVKLRVVGILKKDQYFFQSGLSPQSLYNTNNYILYPIKNLNTNLSNEDVNEFVSSFCDTAIISDKDSEYLENQINSKSEKLNLIKVEIKNGDELIKANYDDCKKIGMYYGIIFFIIVTFTSINIITSMVGYILDKKKEFSINILCGAKKSDLALRILFQNLMITIISEIIAVLIIKISNTGSIIKINGIMILLTAIICFILFILISIIPIIKIYSLDLNTVIKED